MSTESPPAALELRGICKRYRRQDVLKQLELLVQPGEIVGLLGPNGCGKTTTLRIAAGYLWPDSGQVVAGGQALRPDHPDSRRHIGYLPERVPLYDPFSVERYLRFVAGARGLHGQARDRAVDEALLGFDLVDVRRRIIGQLSKGYRQRIGLAQALLGDPRVLLLDEPTNGLDPFQIIEARELIRSVARDRAVIFSTHIMQEVVALCTRVVYLNNGTLTDLSMAGTAAEGGLVDARFSCTDTDALRRALLAFDPQLDLSGLVCLAGEQFQLVVSIAVERRADLLRLLANHTALESVASGVANIEQRLIAVIRAEAGNAA
jgi:ABC-2 type transport system ATP-binding protein